MDARSYRGFADLARHYQRGRDFQISVTRRPSSGVAVIAPHGGGIEQGTSAIARAIAADDLNLYLFEGRMPGPANYAALHLTSRLFDEPECLELLRHCPVVVSIHGCKGTEDKVLLGGLDRALKARIAAALAQAGIARELDGHAFPATNPMNICNRGACGQGVQLEVSGSLRRCGFTHDLAGAVRSAVRAQAARKP
jgi:phage replication-related protein YjqB (UPF0714/DUF867 family)